MSKVARFCSTSGGEHFGHTLASHATAHATTAHAAAVVHGSPPVVEEDDVLQGPEVAVVPIGLHEVFRRHQVHVAKGRDLDLPQLRLVDFGCVAGSLQVTSKAVVDPLCAIRIPPGGHGIVGVVRVAGDTEVVIAEIGEQGIAG